MGYLGALFVNREAHSALFKLFANDIYKINSKDDNNSPCDLTREIFHDELFSALLFFGKYCLCQSIYH